MKKNHSVKRNLFDLDLLNIFLTISIITTSFNAYSQLTTYTNAMPGMQWAFNQFSSEHDVSHGEDWFYNVIETSDGGFLGVGYSELPDPNAPTTFAEMPAIVKVDKNGTKLWEQVFTNSDFGNPGKALSAFETSTGYTIMGDKGINLFYLVIDKSTGSIITNFKFTNAGDFGFNTTNTSITAFQNNFFEEFKEIRNSSGTITGYLYAGNINDNVNNKSLMGAIVAFDASGNINTGFGSSGLLMVSNFSAYETQLRSVSVDYNSGGVPQSIVFSGTRKNVSHAPPYDNDIYIGKADITGTTIYWERNYTETDLGNNGYSTGADSYLCGSPPSGNTTAEFGSYVKQITNGGDYIMTTHCRWSGGHPTCTSYPELDKETYIDLGLGLVKINKSNGDISWAKKIDHSTGIDFFTPIQVLPSSGGFVIGTNDGNDPDEPLVRARIIKTDLSGNITWNNLYMDSKVGQKDNCLFGLCLTTDGGIVYGGNNDNNDEDYEMVKIYPDCNSYYGYTNVYPLGTAYNVTGGVTWTSSRSYYGKVVVASTGVLTISGSSTKIRFADSKMTGVESNITVMPGGKLIVTGGAEITSVDNNTCPGSMWDGIAVVGNKNLDQGTLSAYTTIPNQGFVDINGSTLSNARCAITTGIIGPDHMGVPGLNQTGGVIRAVDSYFINNNRDIQIFDYNNTANAGNNKSLFQRCHFLVNSFANNGENPVFRLYMQNVQGVRVEGNEFNYSAVSAYDPPYRGWGIYSNDAAYTVGDNILGGTITQSSFTDFRYSIEADNCNTLRTINVDHTNFTNTYDNGMDATGHITLHTVNSAQIKDNTISFQASFAWGISINNSKLYTIKNNTITGSRGYAGPMYGGVGIYASNSGTGDHSIYRNNLVNLDGGIMAQYDNGNPSNASDGLKMNCNTFLGNNSDIGMLTDNSTPPSVRKNQGDPSNPNLYVRNRYSASCVGTNQNQWYVDNSCTMSSISHPSNPSATSPYITLPTCGSGLLVLTSAGGAFNFATQCDENARIPAINPDCPCRNCCAYSNISAALSDAIATSNDLQADYDGTVDGGNTQHFLDEINDAYASNATVKSDLLTISPYASDAVLSAYFSRSAVSADDIVEVHNNNKPVTPAVWAVLDALGLDEEHSDQLTTQQAENAVSARQMKEDALGDSKSNLQSIYATKLNYFLLDTLDGAKDTVLALLSDNIGNLPGVELMRIKAYANAGAYTRAFAFADSLGAIAPFDSLITLEEALLALDTSAAGKGKLNTDTTLYDIFNGAAADGNWQALAALRHLSGSEMGLHYLTPPAGDGERLMNQSAAEVKTVTSTSSKINNRESLGMYPNPANTSVNLLFKSRSSSTVNYVILDLLGRQIAAGSLQPNLEMEINTTDLKNGVYFVTLIQDNTIIEKQKLSIAK